MAQWEWTTHGEGWGQPIREATGVHWQMYRTGQWQRGEKRCGRCLWGYLYSWFCFPSVSMFSQQCYSILSLSHCLKKTQGFALYQTYVLSLCLSFSQQKCNSWTSPLKIFHNRDNEQSWQFLPDTSTMSPGTISLALIICTLFLSER